MNVRQKAIIALTALSLAAMAAARKLNDRANKKAEI